MRTEDYRKSILQLDDKQLEIFVRDWAELTHSFHKCIRAAGVGDQGKDVCGLMTTEGFGGDWHNFQCKQYGRSLPTAEAMKELGKILYYASEDAFKAPVKYDFVTPKGINKNLEILVHSPSKMKAHLLGCWDDTVSKSIIENKVIKLNPKLRAFIDSYDFSKVGRITLDEILSSPRISELLSKWFGADPGPMPAVNVPIEQQGTEQVYLKELVEAYAERDRSNYLSQADLPSDSEHREHLKDQREAFFHAEEFRRFYRDCTKPGTIEALEADLYVGIKPTLNKKHEDGLEKLHAVLSQSVIIRLPHPLEQYARSIVRQGACHQFVNEKKFKWRK